MIAYSYHNQRFVDWMRIYKIKRSKLTIQVVNFNLYVWIISNPVKFSESETQTKVIFKAKRGPQQKWNLEFEGYQISKCHHNRKLGNMFVVGCILSWSWPPLNLLQIANFGNWISERLQFEISILKNPQSVSPTCAILQC